MSVSSLISISPRQAITIVAIIFVVFLLLGIGLAYYWIDLERAKKLHPNSIGYGKWYFSLFPRAIITGVLALFLLILLGVGFTVVFMLMSPQMAEARERTRTVKVLKDFEMTGLGLGNERLRQYKAAAAAAR